MSVFLLTSVAWGGEPQDHPMDPVVAHRTSEKVRVDARLDEASWAKAPLFDKFTETFPHAGAVPTMRTEVRVLHDDRFIYIGVYCSDPEPEKIIKNLGRRDSTATADRLEIAIDSGSDHRTAYSFSINAAGVLRDRLLYGDVNSTDTWDAVWEGAAQIVPGGWIAEIAIPLRSLRFTDASNSWGFQVRRIVPRTHQVFDSHFIPREANTSNAGELVVSRFGRLDGLTDIRAGVSGEVLLYAAPKVALVPQYSDSARPTPRLVNPALDIGADFKFAITNRLSLAATINPDFGQVEADQLILNLQNAEPFFPEKRPFFLQGLDIFQPVGSEYNTPYYLFYSRRVGLRAPILAAIKLTGSLTSTIDIGILDAVVLGASNPSAKSIAFGRPSAEQIEQFEANPDRGVSYNWQTPFHIGVNNSLPARAPVPTNYLAAVLRKRFGKASSVGVSFTAATPLSSICQRSDFASEADYLATNCRARGTNALGVDWDLRTEDRVWGWFGQLNGSHQLWGDLKGRQLTDGTVMKPNDLGWGLNTRAGKFGGEGFRFDFWYVAFSKKFDVNDLGFQPLANYHWFDVTMRYVKPNGWGPFRAVYLYSNVDLNWSADGRALPRAINTQIDGAVQFSSFDVLGLKVGLEVPQYETREIPFSGIPFERQPRFYFGLYADSDSNRRFVASMNAFGHRIFSRGIPESGWGFTTEWTLTWRPIDILETRLDLGYYHQPTGARYAFTDPNNVGYFGWQDPELLSATLRQQIVFTPTLSFQLYAQLFTNAVRYNAYYSADLTGRNKVTQADLVTATSPRNVNSHGAGFNLNAVLRWEYRLGSTIYVVYSRAQEEAAPPNGVASKSLWPYRLFSGPAVDTFLVKWTYWLPL